MHLALLHASFQVLCSSLQLLVVLDWERNVIGAHSVKQIHGLFVSFVCLTNFKCHCNGFAFYWLVEVHYTVLHIGQKTA